MKLRWSDVTPKADYLNRRAFIAAGAVAILTLRSIKQDSIDRTRPTVSITAPADAVRKSPTAAILPPAISTRSRGPAARW